MEQVKDIIRPVTMYFCFSITLFIIGIQITVAQYYFIQQQNSIPTISETKKTFLELPSFDIEYLKAIQGVKHTLPVCNYLFNHIDEIPAFSNNLFEAFSNSKNNIPELFHYTNSLLSSKAGGYGPPLRGSWHGKPINSESDINDFFKLEGVNLIHPEEWNKLPYNFRKGVLEFLYYVDRTKTIINEYTLPIIHQLNINEDYLSEDIQKKLMGPWNNRELQSWETIQAIEVADKKILSYASRVVSEKLDWFLKQTNQTIPVDFNSCSIVTCLGELIINGTGNDTINGNKFCVIELGGDDVYRGNTASSVSLKQPIGIVIDLEGNDKYLCENNFLAYGVLGMAILVDVSGDDYYITFNPGLSSSLYGSSLLYDYSGNDIYISGFFTQASSYVGTSLFIDIYGNDKFNCKSYSQGFGGTNGVSVFFNATGNDYYNVPDKTNNSNETHLDFIQGAAKGRWAEATDGQSLAGGIGVFIDNKGTDNYKAHSFSQGASYYFGLGIFSDGQGDDTYNAISHSQGYAAHYSLASFIEINGNDIYNLEAGTEKITQIIGGGRDHSAGLFIEYHGDDTYHFGNRSAGIGGLNGIGLLADFAGNDTYYWHKNKQNLSSPSLGKTLRKEKGLQLSFKAIPEKNFTKGMFHDSNGDKPKEQ